MTWLCEDGCSSMPDGALDQKAARNWICILMISIMVILICWCDVMQAGQVYPKRRSADNTESGRIQLRLRVTIRASGS